MGRRKIEIQPITQERNRSVTFAKRKNGLFKKAYELGVLCSVDVAVIIFETRPGQDPKLHQYCSTDIRRIIQRHGQHHGEKDLKGPSDFSGPAGAATADDGDDDEGGNDEEDEEDRPGRGSKKANRSGLILADQEGSNTNEGGYLSQGPPLGYAGASIYGGHIPPPPPMHGSGPIDPDLAGMGSMLPVSNDRVSSMRESDTRASKRQKRTLDSMDPGSRSPALRAGGRDLLNFAAGPHDPNHQDRFYPEMRPPYLEHGANPGPYPYHNAQNTHHQGFNPNPNYAPMFSAFAPPQPFLPLQSSFGPPPHGPAPGGRDVGQGHPAGGFGGPDASREGRFSGPQFDPALFNPQGGMIPGRHSPQEVNVSQRSQRGSGSQGGERSPIEPAIRERGRPDTQMADRVPSSGGGDASASIEWPSYRHGNTQGGASQSPRVEGSFRPLSALGQSSIPSQDSSVRGNTNDGWLDALSNANPGPVHAAASRPGTSSDTSTRSKGRASRAGTDAGKLGGESDVGGAGGGVVRDGNGAKVETKD